jgi:acetyl esterase/lipase
MIQEPLTDFDDAYANGAYIEGAADYPPRWALESESFRAGAAAGFRGDIPYGPRSRQRFDLFLPDAPPLGLVVFVHGGYWRAFDKSSWSWLAAGPVARGWAVALPSYTLAPKAHISAITQEVANAIATAAAEIDGPIRLIGHSAGGHLVSRMVCQGGPLPEAVARRIKNTVSLSGLHDLRPLLNTEMNRDLRLDLLEATAESPALLMPRSGTRIICWVGADERPELRRQSALLANMWHGIGVATAAVEEPGKHHFNVIDGLAEPDSALSAVLLDPIA